jgi:CheY-like chemotaxis protein
MDNRTTVCRVLLVDDELAITNNLAPFLERAGFAVNVAADGQAAVRLVDGWASLIVRLDSSRTYGGITSATPGTGRVILLTSGFISGIDGRLDEADYLTPRPLRSWR